MIFDPLEFIENKYTCKFVIAGAVVGIAAGVTSIVNSGGGSSGGSVSGGSSGGGSSGPPGYNPGNSTIVSQAPAQLGNTKAADTYNPTNSMNAWSSIFAGMPIKDETTAMPNIKIPDNGNLDDQTMSPV